MACSAEGLGRRLEQAIRPHTTHLLSAYFEFHLITVSRHPASSKASYPHRIFEVGEVAKVEGAGEAQETATYVNAAACIAHPKASFSELHSYLDALFFYLGIKYELKPATHPSFLEGRTGEVIAIVHGESTSVGLIAEVHPEVLERWGVTMPVAAFELSLSKLLDG